MKYERPPITEALVELHFLEDAPDQSVGGRFYDVWKDRCRSRDQMRVQQLQLMFGNPNQSPPMPPGVPTDRLWLNDDCSVIQIGPRILSVHMVVKDTPYPGFEHLEPKVCEAVDVYRSLVSPIAINQISMRYINRLQIPRTADGGSEDWLAVGVALPPAFETIGGLNVQAVVPIDSANADLTYTFRSGTTTQDYLEAWLDLNVISRRDSAPSFDEVPAWLRGAHDAGIIAAFEGSVTDRARESFGMKEDDRDEK